MHARTAWEDHKAPKRAWFIDRRHQLAADHVPDQVEQPSTVFVIDDDPAVLEALEGLLHSVGLVAECFASTKAFLAAQNPDGPSCLILDVRLQRDSGLHFLTRLRKTGAKIPVIIITAYGDIPMAVRAIKDGAINFLSKPVREQDLLDAVGEALGHDRMRRDAHKRLLDLRARYASLTTREQTVMGLICAGLMNKQIASQLGVTEITVKACRHKIMKKLDAKSVPALVRMARRLEIRE